MFLRLAAVSLLTLLSMTTLAPPSARAASIGAVGNLVISTSSAGLVEFDGASGSLLGPFISAQPNDFTFAGSLLYTTDPTDQVIAYDAISGAFLEVLVGPAFIRNAGPIHLAPDGTILLRNQVAGSITLDRFSAAGSPLGTLIAGPINDFVLGPNGNVYATTALNELVEISSSTGIVLDVLSSTLANPGPLVFLADGSIVVRDGVGIRRFSESGESLGVFNSTIVNHLTVGPDGNLYATSPMDTILVFDGVTGISLGTFAATPPNPSLLAFRPVPEPGSGALVVAGLACLIAARRPTRR